MIKDVTAKNQTVIKNIVNALMQVYNVLLVVIVVIATIWERRQKLIHQIINRVKIAKEIDFL